MKFSNDGNLLLSASEDKKIKLWRVIKLKGEASGKITGLKLKYIWSSKVTFTSGVTSVAFSNDD